MSKLKAILGLLLIMSLSIVSYSATQKTKAESKMIQKRRQRAVEKEPVIGMANPASVYCEKQGGKSIIKKDKSGAEYGVCRFKDGKEVDEWEYYRENNKPKEESPAIGMANPASVYCEEQGGKSFVKKDRKGNERGFCKLKNGKVVDEWQYYRKNNKNKK